MNKSIFIIVSFLLVLFVFCQPKETKPVETQLTETERAEIESAIKSIIQEIDKAYIAQDVNQLANFFLKSENLQTVLSGKVTVGWDGYCERTRQWNEENNVASSPSDYVYVDVLSRDAAVVTESGLWTGKDQSGAEIKQRWSWTGVFMKKENEWKIVNAHESYAPAENE